MIDLAETRNDSDMPAMAADSTRKPYYPSVRLNSAQLASLGLASCALGDVYEVTLRLKASNLSEEGSTFDIVAATDKPEEVEEGEESDDETKEKPTKPKPKTVAPGKSRTLKPPADEED